MPLVIGRLVARTLVSATVAIASICVLAPVASAAVKTGPGCWPADSTTYMRSYETRVFKATTDLVHSYRGKTTRYAANSYIVCSMRNGRWTFAYVDEWDGLPPLLGRLTGKYFGAYVNWSCGACENPPTEFFIINAHNGRKVLDIHHSEGSSFGFDLYGLVLSRRGVAVFLIDDHRTKRSGGVQVVKTRVQKDLRHTGMWHQLASGANVVTDSLRRRGSRVVWKYESGGGGSTELR